MIPSSTQNWPTSGGLYRVRLSPTHYYIGRAANFRARWQRHLNQLRSGAHPNQYLLNVYLQYQRFDPEVLIEEADDRTRQTLEQQWLDQHVGSPGCLNLSRSSLGVSKGYKHSEETRAKLRGRVPTDEARRNMSNAQVGHVVSEETRSKLSNLLRGKKRPDNAARNKAAAGWAHTEEAREKISLAGARPCAVTTRLKIRANHLSKGIRPPVGGMLGHRHSDETKQKISAGQKHRSDMSPEERARRSEIVKAGWVQRRLNALGKEPTT